MPARMNLATLLSRQGRNREAEKLLREAIRYQPGWGQAHYSLGLLLAEDRSRLPEATRALEKASAYWTDNPRIFHNLAIAYWQQDKVDPAVASFLRAIELEPDNPEFLQNLLQLLAQRQRWKDALPHARRMVNLMPDNPQAKAFLAQVERSIQP